jgi:hypothetical protein
MDKMTKLRVCKFTKAKNHSTKQFGVVSRGTEMSKCVSWGVLHCICSTALRSPRKNSTFWKTRTGSVGSSVFHLIQHPPWINRCRGVYLETCCKRLEVNWMSRPTSCNILVRNMVLFMRKCKTHQLPKSNILVIGQHHNVRKPIPQNCQ